MFVYWLSGKVENGLDLLQLPVMIVPRNSIAMSVTLAQRTETFSIITRIPIVRMMPNTCADALSRPEDVPSDSGKVNSAANSNPTGR